MRLWRKGKPVHHWWKCKLVQAVWKTDWKFLKKLKIGLPYDSAVLLLGIYWKEMKSLPWRDSCTPMFFVALFPRHGKNPKDPWLDEWVKKIWVHTYTHTNTQDTHTHKHRTLIQSLKKSKILPFVTMWMNLKGIMLSKIRQRKLITVRSHLSVQSEILNSQKQGLDWWLPRVSMNFPCVWGLQLFQIDSLIHTYLLVICWNSDFSFLVYGD